MGVRTKTSFKPGQSGNPKGRPKGQVRFTEVQKAFNYNYAELKDLYEKYSKMSRTDFEKLAKKAKDKRTKLPMQEVVAILYYDDAIKNPLSYKYDVVMGVMTGSYGGGVKEVTEYDLQDKTIPDELIEFHSSEKRNKILPALNTDTLSAFLATNPNMDKNVKDSLKAILKVQATKEQNSLNMVPVRDVQRFMETLTTILKDTIGRNHPRLLLDVGNKLAMAYADTFRLLDNVRVIEVEKVPEKTKKRKKK